MANRLVVLTVTTLLCVLMMELGLRSYGFGRPLIYVYDDVKLWGLARDQRAFAPAYGVEYRTNSLGYRDDEIPIEKPAGEYRILALGDSILFGEGVAFEDTATQRIEAELRRLLPSRSVQVINTAVAGYNFYQYRVITEGEGARLDPDLVLIGLCKNDLVAEADIEILRELAETRLDYRRDLHARVRSWSGLLHLLDGVVARVRARIGIPVPQALEFERQDTAKAAWDYSEQQLASVAAYTRERGIPLLVAAFPTRDEAATGRIRTPMERFARAVEGQGQHFLDLQADFVEAGEEDLFLESVHPTAGGHGIAARAILRILEQRGLTVH